MSCFCGDDDDVKKENELKGPVDDSNRKLRDVIFLILFALFWVGFIVIAGIAFGEGDPRRIIYGTDSWGNLCGRDNDKEIESKMSGLDTRGYGFLYYTNPTDDSAFKLCVKECPQVDTTCSAGSNCEYCLNSVGTPYGEQFTAAVGGVDVTVDEKSNPCPDSVYKSDTRLGLRRCIPAKGSAVLDSFINTLNKHTPAEELMSDLANSTQLIGICALISVIASFVIIVLMRCFGAAIIYCFIALGMIGTLVLSIITYTQYIRIRDDNQDARDAGDDVTDSRERNENFLQGLMIVSWIFTALVWIIVIAMRNRIRLAIAIFEEASSALRALPQLFLMPIWTNAVLIAFLAFWFAVFAFMVTRGDAKKNENLHAEFQDSEDSDYEKQLWYLLLSLFWNSQFILAVGQLVTAGALAKWYFTRDKSELSWTVTSSFKRTMRYHLGSAALGSLIIAIIQLIRAVLYYIQEKTKDRAGFIVNCIIKCCMCCFWCLEKFLAFINKNAYIEISIYGYSFCGAAKRAFTLLASNFGRVLALNAVTSLILFVCKLIVICISGLTAYYWIQNDKELDKELNYWGVVVFFVCLIAYFIADLFMDMYDMAIDTIFLCFAEDSDHNNGEDRPYFMSKNLLKFMNAQAVNEPLKE